MENQEIQLSVSSIVHVVAQALLYIIGLMIQMKVMYICWKDKDGKTWQIHLTHSLSCTLYFLFVIPFWHISTSIPHLSVVTGEWLCYLSAFVTLYGFFIITPNSLLVAIMKYMFIVHNETWLRLGDRKAQRMFMCINLMVPFVLTTISCVAKDFEAYSELTSCFGMTEQIKTQYNTWEKNMQKFFLCNLDTTEKDISDAYTFYVMKQCFCVVKSIVSMFINTNVPEAFFYYKIFGKMKR